MIKLRKKKVLNANKNNNIQINDNRQIYKKKQRKKGKKKGIKSNSKNKKKQKTKKKEQKFCTQSLDLSLIFHFHGLKGLVKRYNIVVYRILNMPL